MSRSFAVVVLVGCLFPLLPGCGDVVEKTEVLSVSWEGSSVSVGGTCQNHGQVYDDVSPTELRIDVSVKAVEVMGIDLVADVSGGGDFSLLDFGLAEPDEQAPFLRASQADCGSSAIVLSDNATAEPCLESMRDLVNNHDQDPYGELIEAINERDGLQLRGTMDCAGSVDIDWRIDMRIWTWQRRDW